ncbi:MAG: YtxH domain-containing protein [Candidatus Acidiferrales bacterium]
MAEKTDSKVSYFLVGLGIGWLISILLAPKSGEETRKYLSQKAKEGSEYAQRKARELRGRTDDSAGLRVMPTVGRGALV